MNLKLTLIFVAITSIGVAQEVAKKNEAVYAEWIALKLKNDSLENVLIKRCNTVSSEISTIKANLDGVLKTLNYSIEEQNYYCNKLTDSLKNLSVDLSELGAKPKALTNYYGLCAGLKSAAQFPVRVVSMRNQGLDESLPNKTEEQAQVLAQRLSDEKTLHSKIIDEISRIEMETKKLIQFKNESTSCITTYSDQLSTLKLYNKSLELTRAEVKEEYASTGPSGYGLIYREYFPDLFQDKDIAFWKIANRNINTGTAIKTPVKTESKPLKPVGQDEIATQDELVTQDELKATEASNADSKGIFDIVEQEAQFPGGSTKMGEFIRDNLHYPDFPLDMGIGGRVYLRFVISDKGVVSDVKVTRGAPFCEECDAEAVRVIKSMPTWIPGMNQGKPVNMWYNLPIKFTP